METLIEEPGATSHQGGRKPAALLRRLYSSIVALVLGGSMWIAFFAIAMQQTNWQGVPPTIPAAFVVGLVGLSVFVVGIAVSLLLVSRLVKGLQA